MKWTFAVVLSVVLAASAHAQNTDSLLGTFKLNVAKSTYSPGPPPKGETRTRGYVNAVDAFDAAGRADGEMLNAFPISL